MSPDDPYFVSAANQIPTGRLTRSLCDKYGGCRTAPGVGDKPPLPFDCDLSTGIGELFFDVRIENLGALTVLLPHWARQHWTCLHACLVLPALKLRQRRKRKPVLELAQQISAARLTLSSDFNCPSSSDYPSLGIATLLIAAFITATSFDREFRDYTSV
ncbi:hypothetical protein B0H19DRAFT_1247287 [Mycena capillaripes]|nr:hypothetical protein B0H19DRAFT_1247287 [Mycena capillaripes]